MIASMKREISRHLSRYLYPVEGRNHGIYFWNRFHFETFDSPTPFTCRSPSWILHLEGCTCWILKMQIGIVTMKQENYYWQLLRNDINLLLQNDILVCWIVKL